MTDFSTEKATAAAWFRQLRDEIVAAFEGLEDNHATGPLSDAAPGRFEVTETRRASDGDSDSGGGLMSVMRGGRVFEKVGVNVSEVYGTLSDRAQAAMIHDRVLQQLVAAKLALEFERHDDARTAVDRGLAATSQLVLDLDPDGRIALRGGDEHAPPT